jgi:hypothetical protein
LEKQKNFILQPFNNLWQARNELKEILRNPSYNYSSTNTKVHEAAKKVFYAVTIAVGSIIISGALGLLVYHQVDIIIINAATVTLALLLPEFAPGVVSILSGVVAVAVSVRAIALKSVILGCVAAVVAGTHLLTGALGHMSFDNDWKKFKLNHLGRQSDQSFVDFIIKWTFV